MIFQPLIGEEYQEEEKEEDNIKKKGYDQSFNTILYHCSSVYL